MGTAVQPKNKFTQLATDVIERMVVPELHYTKLIGGEQIVKREQVYWEEREIDETIAEAVERNTTGNDNKFNRFTGKMITGAEFHEKLNINEILVSIIGYGQANDKDSGLKADFVAEVKKRMEYINAKITRATELASAEYFKSGVITYKTHPDGFDFARPAQSIVDLGAPGYWTLTTAALETQVIADIDYFRTYAKYNGGEFDWTMSKKAYINLMKNDFFTDVKKQISYSAIELVSPRFNKGGATFMGTFQVSGRHIHMYIYDGMAKGAQGGAGLEYYMPEEYVVKTPTSMEVGKVTYFPIDSAIAGGQTGLPNPIFKKVHTWDHMETSSDTLVKHVKTRRNVIAYRNKITKTDKILA